MIWNNLNEPRANGVTDWRDSAVIASLIAIFGYHDDSGNRPDIANYITPMAGFVRCTGDDPNDTSRDNTVPVIAWAIISDYRSRDMDFAISKIRLTGQFQNGDWVGPIENILLKKYYNKNYVLSPWDKFFCWCAVQWIAKFRPMSEPNQFLCSMAAIDDKYIKLWTEKNREWKVAIREYWDGWRNEPLLSEHIIDMILATKENV